MEIQFELKGNKGVFFISQQEERLALMTFSKASDSLLIIDHTEVGPALKGTGAGKKLVAAAVEYARINRMKILPLCPFAKAMFDKTPEYQDVLSL